VSSLPSVAVALLFASIAAILVLTLLNVEIETGDHPRWWIPVLATFVGGFSLIAVFVTGAIVALKGWP